MSDKTEPDGAASLALTVKDTRHGKLLVYGDESADGGFRGMTDAERKANDFIGKIVDSFHTEPFEHNKKVGAVSVTDSGELSVEWCCERAESAAGGVDDE